MRGEWLTTARLILIVSVRRSHWFHTIMILPADLDREFNNSMPAIKKRQLYYLLRISTKLTFEILLKRTSRFAILGMSLSTLLDIHQPQDLLRGLLNVITEFELSKEEGENKSKMVCYLLYVLRELLNHARSFPSSRRRPQKKALWE